MKLEGKDLFEEGSNRTEIVPKRISNLNRIFNLNSERRKA